jgi:VWFA-related protein
VHRSALLLLMCMLVAGSGLGARQAGSAQPPRFKSSVDLVLVDLVVRDRNGAPVRDLKADDFELFENGVRQTILSFAREEIARSAAAVPTASTLAALVAPSRPATASSPAATDETPAHPLTSEEVAGHRVMVLVFDTSSMQPEDVQSAIDSATKWVGTDMSPADLVAVAAINSSLQVLTDFTNSRARVQAVLASLAATDGAAFSAVDASTAASDEASQTETTDTSTTDVSAQELDTFNNDVRLRALKTLADALQPIQQKKAIIYFSSGMQRSGTDNQVELRAAVNAAVRANVAIYPVDARGLQAVIPGGSARQGSGGGLAAFTGAAVTNQFSQLFAQQETLTSLASDTGGQAFTDTNDFGEAFRRVERDISSYYILGFSSTNPNHDGRFRRLSVRLRTRTGFRIEARDGYYADRDFAHTARRDRETLLQEQLTTPIPSTDVPLFVTAGWFRLAADRYYVPISLVVPGSAVPKSPGKVMLDVAGLIRDERGLPVGRIRDTLTVPPASASELEGKQVLYQTGVTLPPGRFLLKIVVRDTTGLMGTFETPVVVPELKRAAVKVSSLVLGTQLEAAQKARTASPLVRDGVELVPNITHIVRHDRKIYIYYEVYDPAAEKGSPDLETSLGFYRGKMKVFETPAVQRTRLDAPDRHAAVFQFEVPADSFKAGLYTCQVNIIDEGSGRFAFPRFEMYVR